ncbi:GGDEF domain-containing protein [Actinoplanes sp. LDG1-06]|uniref:GGDEF domain-containing protein n=1 Tax=Paractinoplanes ovalisporus TaxID=2810368 RepID=A0ABS2A3F3_9ACTN|nr:GGDEF domain-containing protein [Actinoplanes ovalisporus]MBM2614366.1 GGDEF domain-containing protein [Actinoplanes ovalisporus]
MSPPDEHAQAIEHAYALIEAAQGEMSPEQIEAACRQIGRDDWADVEILLHFARSLAVRETGVDHSSHLQDMLRCAVGLGDPVLLSLALAASAARRADARRALDVSEGAASPFVRAVGLLDTPGGPVVHRVAAQIEVGQVAHLMGFWEVALEHHDLADKALDAEAEQRWPATVRRQRIVIAINQVDLVLDWSCAQAMIGDWAGAADRVVPLLKDADAVVGPDWPPSWRLQYHGHVLLLAALAGVPFADFFFVDVDEAVAMLASAIRAARAGDAATAARLADGLVLPEMTPASARLLALSLVAHRPGTPAAALRYGDELARLRWSDRIERMTAMRDAIEVERRRIEHEQLRRDVLTDDLTRLANRRGYQAYLAGDLSAPDYAVMMIDVDHFKQVNDRFGHDVGDLVLAAIGGILSQHVRPADLAARLGGDEFVVILAGVRPEVTESRAQAVVDAVREFAWPSIAPGLAVSISIGVHHGGPDQLAGLASDADKRLYRAKSSGRGRVVV